MPKTKAPIVPPDAVQVKPPAPAAAAPSPPPPAAGASSDTVPAGEFLELLRKAAEIDWTQADIDLPRSGFVTGVNVTIDGALLDVTCECGAQFRVDADGASRSKCPGCGRLFRHVVMLQDEAAMPSAAGLLLEELFCEMGVRPRKAD